MTLETEPINITVERGNEVDAGGVVIAGPSQKDVRTLGSDIRFISTKAPGLVAKGVFFVGSSLFWALAALLVVLAVASPGPLSSAPPRPAQPSPGKPQGQVCFRLL